MALAAFPDHSTALEPVGRRRGDELSGCVGPAVAALTLGVDARAALAQRMGRNAAFIIPPMLRSPPRAIEIWIQQSNWVGNMTTGSEDQPPARIVAATFSAIIITGTLMFAHGDGASE